MLKILKQGGCISGAPCLSFAVQVSWGIPVTGRKRRPSPCRKQRFHRKEEWRAGSKDWEELLQAFNRTYPEFRERLKKKIPKLSEQEWRMCCLIKMDVPPSTMAMLLCCTNQAISMRRVRLYQKMTGEKGTPELCDSFIRDF